MINVVATTVEEFDSVRVTNLAAKFKDDEGEAIKFGCAGQMQGESEIQTIVKNCEGVQVKQKSTVTKMTLTVTAHVKVAVIRKIFGLSGAELKPGVYAYGADSKFGNFCLTADVIDEFEDITKLIAFPNCSSNNGFAFNIENGADEVAELEIEFSAMQDDFRKCYYEAIIDELEDPTLADTWRTGFTHELVAATPTP